VRLLLAAALALATSAQAADLLLTLRDAAGQPVADAVAWAEPTTADATPRPLQASIKQLDREFVPTVTVVPVGSSISFPNEDPMLHHVYSFSPARPFEIKLYKGTAAAPVLFDKPGVVAIGCNIHDWMEAYVVVVPSRYFGLSAARGVVRLANLPADRWKLHVWHPRQKEQVADTVLDLSAGEHRAVPVTLDLKPREAKVKPPESTTY
jgi:plastocyanin